MIASLYRCLPDDQLDHAIGKLDRLVRSLDRQGTLPRLANDYRRALDMARQERSRRHV